MTGAIHILGWMLVHSLWQDVLIWGVLEGLLLTLTRVPAHARYRLACIALLLMALLPWLTFDWGDLHQRLNAGSHGMQTTSVSEVLASPLPERPEYTLATPPPFKFVPVWGEAVLPFLVIGWVAGLLLMLIRLGWRWFQVQSLLHSHLRPLEPEWARRFAHLVRVTGAKKLVRLGESISVSAPTVGGWLKPVIFLPLGVMASMPAEQVEIVLLHELAHIVRHDYLVNILQVLVETLFFYHPCVWDLSRRIRRERELACDDQTLVWRDEPQLYAEALAQFEEFRSESLTLASSGNGDFFLRIRRILSGPPKENRAFGLAALAAAGCIGAYLLSMFLVPVFAAKVMTAQERAAAISSLQQPPPLLPSDKNAENVSFTGKLATADGKPLPRTLFEPRTGYEMILRNAQAQLTSQRSNTSMAGALTINNVEKQTYNANVWSGQIDLAIWAEGYAPLRRTADIREGGGVHWDLQLPIGFSGRIKVLGNTGQPLPDAAVTATLYAPQTRLAIGRPQVTTGSNGTAVFGEVEENTPVQILIRKPGWQEARPIVMHWSQGGAASCVLDPALATTGQIVDCETQRPVADVSVSLAAERAPGDPGFQIFYFTEQPLTKADNHGRFDLSSLNSETSYRIYLQAPGYTTESFPVQYGARDQVFTLSHGFHIRGKIIDRTGELTKSKYYHPINLECAWELDATPYNSYESSHRLNLPKLGREIPFYFENLPAGRTDLYFAIGGLNQYRHEMNLQKNVDDLVLDLDGPAFNPQASALIKRSLEITVQAPTGQPPPTGVLNLQCQGDGFFQPESLPLTNGTAKIEIPLTRDVQIVSDSLLGYWFSPQEFAFPAGLGPLRRTVSALPAGALHGAISLGPDLKEKRFAAWPLVFQKPPALSGKDLFSGMPMTATLEKGYVTPPLPFGGTYAVVLQVGATFAVSSPALVDSEHPLVTRDLIVSAGHDSLRGRLLDDKIQPIRFQDVRLIFHPTPKESMDANVATTDADGNFVITHLNFDVPGNYEVQLYDSKWHPSDIRIDQRTQQPVTIRFHPL